MMVADEIRDDYRCTAGYALLTMYQNALPTFPRLLNVGTDLFQKLCIQLLRGHILDIDAIAREAFFLREHKPGDVEHLDDVRNVEVAEVVDGWVYDGGERAKVETALDGGASGCLGICGREDVVKGGRHGILDLGW